MNQAIATIEHLDDSLCVECATLPPPVMRWIRSATTEALIAHRAHVGTLANLREDTVDGEPVISHDGLHLIDALIEINAELRRRS